MNPSTFFANMLASTILAVALAGCNDSQSETATGAGQAVDEHGHTAVGPHGGSIIELGEYHAELVHDDEAGTVAVYVLDGAAAENVPIDATTANINISHGGKGEQFKLEASPMEGEPEGWSSRFVSSDAHLLSDLDEDGAEAVFVVSINGKPHRGKIEHAAHDRAQEHAADEMK